MSLSQMDVHTDDKPDTDRVSINRAVLQEIHSLSPLELNSLPFGAICLDEDGTILSYNNHEAKLTGRDPKLVIGKNFFTEVAPCTNVQEFAGRFREGVQARDLHTVFPYRFDFKMKPRRVWVTLFYCEVTEAAWVFVREEQDDP